MNESEWDVVVLGAGAAGLMAGISAGQHGARTLVLEKNSRPGVKILMSGGTRCNLTHNCDNRGIVEAFGRNGKFLHSALAAFGVTTAIAFFEQAGVATKVESTGKVFPVSNRAADVLQALLNELQQSGSKLALNEPAINLVRTNIGWQVETPVRRITASRVVLTTGGQSYPASGTTGDGYRVAAQFGHCINVPRPALTPITTNAAWLPDLRGITLPDAALSLAVPGQKPVARRGSLLFAHFGLTGPVALDLSRIVSGHPNPRELVGALDLLPSDGLAELDAFLQTQAIESGKKQLATILAERLPHRIAQMLLHRASQPVDCKAAGLSRPDRQRLAGCIKSLPVPVTGTLGFAKAEVTAGGVALDGVDSKTMQSKLAPGLYLAGEVLDLDGPIGGFNFQAAWSTGWLAGFSAAKK